MPFLIGRQGENNLVLRDNRISRSHARISADNGEYVVEDLDSRHGVFVNGQRVKRHMLKDGDRIDFGFPDSYRLAFTLQEDELNRVLGQMAAPAGSGANNLSKLRSLVEVARALQSSLSTSDVLAAVVDAALSVTGAERGFLLLGKDDQLEVSVARDRRGAPLDTSDLGVPRSLINRALRTRRDLLSMTFDPLGADGFRPEMSVADLELRSVVCVPLIQVRTGSMQETVATSLNNTVGVLYMDSRETAADLSAGNREILQTLALEASTILENARLLEEERAKQHMEEELNIARSIQTGLLPSELPTEGWFRATGSSIASRQVGGDYFDVRRVNPDMYACIIVDVSGKGVSAALLAALLQGAFVFASEGDVQIDDVMSRVNRFLIERARGREIRHGGLLHRGPQRPVALVQRRPSQAGSGAGHRRIAVAGQHGFADRHDGYRVVRSEDRPTAAGRQSAFVQRRAFRSGECGRRVLRQESVAGISWRPRRGRLRRTARETGGGGGRFQRSVRARGRHHDAGPGVSTVAWLTTVAAQS